MKKLTWSLLFLAACSSSTSLSELSEDGRSSFVHVVGSSTLYPLTQKAASEFASDQRQVRISVTGTTKGFADLCSKQAAIVAASRSMNEGEKSECKKSKINVICFPLAFDAITLVAHPENTWAKYLTVSELRRIWSPESQGRLVNWNQIREGFPDHPLVLLGPGRDSGTFDSFSERIVGRRGALRRDYQSSEDDYLIVHEIAKNQGSLGFIGLSYAQSKPEGLIIVAVGESAHDAVLPSVQTVQSGSYKDLARLTYLYTSSAALARADRKEFLEHYLQLTMTKGKSMGFVPLSGQEFAASLAQLKEVNHE